MRVQFSKPDDGCGAMEIKLRAYVSSLRSDHYLPQPSHGKTVTLLVYQLCSCGFLTNDIWDTDVLVVTISVASATVGFLCGSACGSAHRERKSRDQVEPPPAVPNPKERDGHDFSDDEDSIADGNLSTVSPGLLQPCKLVRLSCLSTTLFRRRLPPAA